MLARLRPLLADAEMCDIMGGDLAAHVRRMILDRINFSSVIRDVLEAKVKRMAADLAGPEPTAVERLLAERIAADWLHLQSLEHFRSLPKLDVPSATHYDKCLDRAHARYLSALKTLATVRKLAVPALQVNIARKQVNVAG